MCDWDDWVQVSAVDFKSILAFAESEKKKQQNAVVSGPQKPIQRTVSKLLQPGASTVPSTAASSSAAHASAAGMADDDKSRSTESDPGGNIVPAPPSPSSGSNAGSATSDATLLELIALAGGRGLPGSKQMQQYILYLLTTAAIPSSGATAAVTISGVAYSPIYPVPYNQRSGEQIRHLWLRVSGYFAWNLNNAIPTTSAASTNAASCRLIIFYDGTPGATGIQASDNNSPPVTWPRLLALYGMGTEFNRFGMIHPMIKPRIRIVHDKVYEPEEFRTVTAGTANFFAFQKRFVEEYIDLKGTLETYNGVTSADQVINALKWVLISDNMPSNASIASFNGHTQLWFENVITSNRN